MEMLPNHKVILLAIGKCPVFLRYLHIASFYPSHPPPQPPAPPGRLLGPGLKASRFVRILGHIL